MEKKNIMKKILIATGIVVIISVITTIGIGNYFVNYAIKRHLRKFGIKNETFCFFYLTVIIIFVAKLKNFIGNLHLNKR